MAKPSHSQAPSPPSGRSEPTRAHAPSPGARGGHLSGCSAPACRTLRACPCRCGHPSGPRSAGYVRSAPDTAAPREVAAAARRPVSARRAATATATATAGAAARSRGRAWRGRRCGLWDAEGGWRRARGCVPFCAPLFPPPLRWLRPFLPADVGPRAAPWRPRSARSYGLGRARAPGKAPDFQSCGGCKPVLKANKLSPGFWCVG